MSTALPPDLSPRSGAPGPGTSGRRSGVLGWLATALAVAVLVTSVGGWGLLTYYDGKIQRIPGLGGLLAGSSDGPVNLLVVGVDSRAGLTPEQQQEMSVGSKGADIGQRSDTMMLVHVAGDRDDVTVVSLPRDSLVTIPAYTDADGDEHAAQRNKLNAAYAFGGAPLLIETVQQLTGLDINHYVEVGFAGVVNMVDAVDGVDVCVPVAVNDRASGLALDAGPTHVDGAMGLAFVRARHIDPTADIGRMERQQQFIAAMFQRATSLGVLLNPAKLSAFLDAALSSVTVDQSLSRDQLLDLAGDLQGLKPRNLRFLTVPIADADGYVEGVGSVVEWDKPKARLVFSTLQSDEPLVKPQRAARATVPPGQVRVQVLNGSSVSGLATRASDALSARGFAIGAPAGNADRTDVTTTVIQYDPAWDESLKTVQAAFPGAKVEEVAGLGETFLILVGTEYTEPSSVRLAKAAPGIDSRTAADDVCG